MPTPLIRARDKPRFGLPWLAIVLGICTLVFGLVGWEAVTAKPEAQLEIVVQGQHPWNISQETVDAVVTEPIKTMKPMRLLVTDQLLSFDEVLGRVDFGADVILSTAVAHSPVGTPGGKTRAGAGLSGDLSKANGGGVERNAVGFAYLENAGLGHGPLAVAAAAQRAADVVDPGPIRTPAFWLAGTVLGMALTVISVSFSLSRRGRRERLFRRLSAAQHQMAGVVLDLEALEVTYRTTTQDRRTRGYTATWHAICDDSLALARTEDAVVAAVHGRRSALKPATAVMVEGYEGHARVLADNADALLAAGSVLGTLDGSQSVLDRLAAPMTLSARELLARLAAAGPRAATPKQLRRLEKSLDGLLEVVGRDKAGAASIEAWKKAETELQRSVTGILRSLRRRRAEQVSGSYKVREDVSSLRIGLGLSRTGSRLVLSTLDETIAATKALFGTPPGLPVASEIGAASGPPTVWDPWAPRPRRRKLLAGGGALIVILALTLSALLMPPSPQSTYVAPEIVPLRSLVLDGDTASLSESGIRSYMRPEFTRETDVTVAVRSAGEYLGIYPNQSAPEVYSVSGQDPKVLLDAMWQVKAQFPELLDPVSGELRADQAIIPVWSLGDGSYMAPALLAGAVSGRDGFDLGHTDVGYGTYFVSASPDSLVSREIDELSRGHQFSGLTSPDINRSLLYALLVLSIGLGLVLLVLVGNFGGIVSMRLGRFGRDAVKLKTIHDSLESLALGLDESRLNNVTMLGQRPTATAAESDQRIFERALALAWRSAADLASRPLSHRLSELYVADIEKLATLVSLLTIRDGDAQRRTQALLDAARGGAHHL